MEPAARDGLSERVSKRDGPEVARAKQRQARLAEACWLGAKSKKCLQREAFFHIRTTCCETWIRRRSDGREPKASTFGSPVTSLSLAALYVAIPPFAGLQLTAPRQARRPPDHHPA